MANVTIAPDADTATVGNWLPNTGATYYAVLDEASANDSDFILSGATPSQDKIKIRLSDPASAMNDPMTVAVRCKASAGTINLAIRLVEGTTTRAEWTESGIATTWTTVTHDLTAGERASISDFTNLYIELEANPATGFTGLLDTYSSAAFAYSFRKLRAAYAGSAVRIRESGGNTEQDIGFDANGDFDTAAAATFIGANTGYIVKWYDQSGNGLDVSNATAAAQPLYVASGIGSKPSLSLTGSTNLTKAAFDLPASMAALTNFNFVAAIRGGTLNGTNIYLVYDWTVSTSLRTELAFAHGDPLWVLDFGNDTNSGAGGRILPAPAANNADAYNSRSFFLQAWRDSLDSQNMQINNETTLGAQTRAADLTTGSTAVLAIGSTNGSNYFWSGQMTEVILWGGDIGSANRGTMLTSINSYYGLF